jgi:hypothetical protein
MALAIWANSVDVPTSVCFDARLRDRRTLWETISLHNTTYGQAGWDIGIANYGTFHSLAEQLLGPHALIAPEHVRNRLGVVDRQGRIRAGQITRLAINAHGGPGALFVDGRDRPPLTSESLASAFFERDLEAIRDATHPHAVILLVGCVAGQGDEGSLFLRELSKRLPHRKVVGFVVIGWVAAGAMTRGSSEVAVTSPSGLPQVREELCTEPGMRLTHRTDPVGPQEEERVYGRYWNNLGALPWASEHSYLAKIARDGNLIQDPDSRGRGTYYVGHGIWAQQPE